MNYLKELQEWYHENCNGDWEHSYGIKIETLDNPGWHVCIDLTETVYVNKGFKEISKGMDSPDENKKWIHCEVKNSQFNGYADPEQLNEVFEIFIDWVNKIKKET